MNSAQALSKVPHRKCLDAIGEYLARHGYCVTLASLEAEADYVYEGEEDTTTTAVGEEKSEAVDASDTTLMRALMQYEERAQAFKDDSHSKHVAQIEEMMNSLKITTASPATLNTYTLQPHISNIITAQLYPRTSPPSTLVASGGVDKMIRITDYTTQEVRKTVFLSAPILCIDYHRTQPNLLLVGSMNGEVSLVDANVDDASSSSSSSSTAITTTTTTTTGAALLQSLALHTKYVVGVKWSPDGTRAASASHDGKVQIMRLTHADASATSAAAHLHVEHVQEYTNAIETIAWLDARHLLICPREDNYIHVLDVHLKQERCRINVNASGDDHVSFSCMHVSVSPDGRFIAVASDQHRLIVFAAGTARRHRGGIALRENSEIAVTSSSLADSESLLGIQVRNYYGLQNDGFSNPRTAWSPDSRYVYVSSQDKTVCVYDVGLGHPVATLRGHDVNVRDVSTHPTVDGLLVTCSFDKTVRVWKGVEA